ncbi:VOC family protein [Kitasatospora sp. A2-31]|uniref:VOC family protein n=1 Tax=Kitasatospora sp. A2-31 TaxID=2916414 RepID=UPI001EEC2969|nr:VOC family protein [Kitasatospora sp. A2-31]MCG6498749.1 VOC family protein [Kitasatospora sp. A2-31]
MPRRTWWREGTPSRIDLRTTDREAAMAFYGGLFGWEFKDRDLNELEFKDSVTPEAPGHTIAMHHGGVVAGIVEAGGASPAWWTYLAVDDIEAAAAKVEAAGGSLLMPPGDGVGAERTALAVDPTGALVGLCARGEGAEGIVVNEPGAYTWSELMTGDRDTALAFHREVFGLTVRVVDLGGSPFTGLVAGEDMVGGVIPLQRERAVARWIVYFAVTDVEETAARAEALGGSVVHGPIDTPVGPLAALRDPQGAAFSVWAVNLPAR